MRVSRWAGFSLWALVGGLYGLMYLSILGIGIVILPIAIIATVIAARRLAVWPEIFGFALGPAAAMMRLVSFDSKLRQCAPGEQAHMKAIGSGSGSVEDGIYATIGYMEGCVDMNAELLRWGGIALAAAATALYVAARYWRVVLPFKKR